MAQIGQQQKKHYVYVRFSCSFVSIAVWILKERFIYNTWQIKELPIAEDNLMQMNEKVE